MKSEYAVEITDLNKTYLGNAKQPPKEALSNINLNIPTGSFFGLLGPNGSGKSTIINIMEELVIKSSGEFKVCGYDIETQMRDGTFVPPTPTSISFRLIETWFDQNTTTPLRVLRKTYSELET